MAYCVNCGTQLVGKFCANCGTPAANSPAQPVHSAPAGSPSIGTQAAASAPTDWRQPATIRTTNWTCANCLRPITFADSKCKACGHQNSRYPGAGGQEAPSVATTFWITLFFGLFGIIPAAMHANRAMSMNQDSSKYWMTFGLTVVASFVLWVLIVSAS